MGTEAKGKKKVTSGKKGRKKAGGRDSSSFRPLAPSRLWELGIMPASIFPTFSSPPPPIPAFRASFFRAGNTSTVDVQQCMIFRSPFAFRLLLRAPSEREDLHVCLRTFLREAPLPSPPLPSTSRREKEGERESVRRGESFPSYIISKVEREDGKRKEGGWGPYTTIPHTRRPLPYPIWRYKDGEEPGRGERGYGGCQTVMRAEDERKERGAPSPSASEHREREREEEKDGERDRED